MNTRTIHDHPLIKRDLAHEADMRELHRDQLRADVDASDVAEAYEGRLRMSALIHIVVTVACFIAYGVMLGLGA